MDKQLEMQRCAHCNGSGTCRNGKDGESCAVCSKISIFSKYQPAHGLVCSICKGTGFIEPVALRLKYRTGPVIAMFVTVTAVITIIVGHENHFSEVLAFLGTLTGSITGFYFSRKKYS